ncbi:MAG: hypothetical protein OQL27_01770 [Sedimenticola sp.]|nr:hypothetical protein [Sedimenticola sp.]
MLGLLIVVFALAYFMLSLYLIAKVKRHIGSAWALGVGLFMYLIIFWDWIPMEITYEQQCNDNAGFFVTKSIEEWKKENPGVWGTLDSEYIPEKYLLRTEKGRKMVKRLYYKLPDGLEVVAYYDSAGKYMFTKFVDDTLRSKVWLNWRFYKTNNESKLHFHILRTEKQVLDRLTGDTLAKHIDFRTDILPIGLANSLRDIKFWMQRDSCPNVKENSTHVKFNGFVQAIEQGA